MSSVKCRIVKVISEVQDWLENNKNLGQNYTDGKKVQLASEYN